MKIAFSSSGEDLGSPLDVRFGRAPKFVIFDIDRESYEVIDNGANVLAAQGAGIQAAETVARSGANAVVTGHCGPNAFRVLGAAGIKVYNTDAPTVGEALERYRSGKLAEAKSENTGGHRE
ncbi:MAG: dinitrogenase iron-molybdenum cofactor biosynthesis protein [Candidatus Latescibacterota bacterium]|nr:MAG: dinitrogenase iron-molybdenum cofactor biosynthesis protein [Candidatus Latescibacterota bacterium]